METLVTLRVNDTPPSFNTMGTRGTHWPLTKAKKEWQAHLGTALLMASHGSEKRAERLPRRLLKAHATAMLRFPTKRGRDEGNYRAILEKALGDALTSMGYLPNDTPEFFTFGTLDFVAERGPHLTAVDLWYETARSAAK